MSDCLFCSIIRGEVNSQKVFENKNIFAFVDIHPQAKQHYLFIHKAHSSNINEMSEEEVSQVFAGIKEFTKSSELVQSGFRVVTNTGPDACQTVFHTHFHVLGGEQLSNFGR